MKVFIFLFLILMAMSSMVFSKEVKLGELTGIGSRFSLNKLTAFVHEEGVIERNHCQKIVVKKTDNPKVSDIVEVVYDGKIYTASEFKGFVVEN